ncbi:MAG: cereblon family protein [Spirochaetota bacterium]
MYTYNNYNLFEQNKIPVWMFKKCSFKNVELIDIQSGAVNGIKSKRENLILCKYCNYAITSPKHIIRIEGEHNHTFKNPYGSIFNIGCFSSAEGCLNHGDFTTEHTWFKGFGWCYASCTSCYIHLGWYFKSHETSFYGLILNKLIENI